MVYLVLLVNVRTMSTNFEWTFGSRIMTAIDLISHFIIKLHINDEERNRLECETKELNKFASTIIIWICCAKDSVTARICVYV